MLPGGEIIGLLRVRVNFPVRGQANKLQWLGGDAITEVMGSNDLSSIFSTEHLEERGRLKKCIMYLSARGNLLEIRGTFCWSGN